jgi:NAD(P)-dependent dehydrogenase (short-subunit alcohol dehydrogenase family)
VSTPLTDVRCLVIGAGRGIGTAVAARIVADGGRCHATRRQTAAAGPGAPDCTWSVGDVRQPGDVDRMVSEAVDRLGGLDALVYCPGVAHVGPVADTPAAAWTEAFEVNVRGFGLAVRAALPVWHEQGNGCAVALSSQAARRGQSLIAAYTATKAAIDGMVRALAVELAPVVRVNAVAPGIVMTDMIAEDFARQARLDRVSTDEVAERSLRRIPLRDFQSADAVAAGVAFLIGRDGRHITGEVLAVDGGMSA